MNMWRRWLKAMQYKTVHFYARKYERKFKTKQAALDAIKARSHNGVRCYTELWEMKDEENGEQIALFEYDNVLLIPK